MKKYLILGLLALTGLSMYLFLSRQVEVDIEQQAREIVAGLKKLGIDMGYEDLDYSLHEDRTTLYRPWFKWSDGASRSNAREIVFHEFGLIPVSGIISSLRVDVLGMQIPTPGIVAALPDMDVPPSGIDGETVLVDMYLDYAYDQEAERIDLEQFELYVPGIGAVGTQMELGQVPIDLVSLFTNPDHPQMLLMVQNVMLREWILYFHDDGVLRPALMAQAEQQGLTWEEYHTMLREELLAYHEKFADPNDQTDRLDIDSMERLLSGEAKRLLLGLDAHDEGVKVGDFLPIASSVEEEDGQQRVWEWLNTYYKVTFTTE